MDTAPKSPRTGLPRPVYTKKIEANTIFENVQTERKDSEERRSDAKKHIIQLKDNRGLGYKLMGMLVQEEDAEKLNMAYGKVKNDFDKYKEIDVEIPETIQGKFEHIDKDGKVTVYGSPAYISDKEAEELEEIAYDAERKLTFQKQLKERGGLDIKGNLIDGLKKPITEDLLKTYCDGLKKYIQKMGLYPDLLTTDSDPQKFIFFRSKDSKPYVLTVKTQEDLQELENLLKEANVESENQGKKGISFDTKDPFKIKEGEAKRQILRELSQLSVDSRDWWDRMWGAIGIETDHVKETKASSVQLFKQIEASFNRVVGRQNLEANESYQDVVFSELSGAVQDKLQKGQPLNSVELRQVQEQTFLAMQRQRYIDDLRERVPADIVGSLSTKLKDAKIERGEFHQYLHKLKGELIRGGYPALITSDSDVRKFIFFNNGVHEEIIVEKKTDLDKLEDLLRACRKEAESYVPEEAKLENIVARQQEEIAKLKKQVEVYKGHAEIELEDKKKFIDQEKSIFKRQYFSETDQLKKDLQVQGEIIQELEERNKALELSNETIRSENDKFVSGYKKLELVAEKYKETYEKFDKANEELYKANEVLKSEYDKLLLENEKFRSSNKRFDKANEELYNANKDFELKNEELKNEVVRLTLELNELKNTR